MKLSLLCTLQQLHQSLSALSVCLLIIPADLRVWQTNSVPANIPACLYAHTHTHAHTCSNGTWRAVGVRGLVKFKVERTRVIATNERESRSFADRSNFALVRITVFCLLVLRRAEYRTADYTPTTATASPPARDCGAARVSS